MLTRARPEQTQHPQSTSLIHNSVRVVDRISIELTRALFTVVVTRLHLLNGRLILTYDNEDAEDDRQDKTGR